MIVEGDAGRDDIEQSKAAVTDGGLDQRHELLLVPRETSADKGGAYFDRQPRKINGGLQIDITLLVFCARVHSGRILPLRKTITAVVLDNIGHV